MSGLRDAQLRRALRGDVLAEVKRLEWDEYNAEADRTWKPISDLSGLEACVALEHVGLVGNHVSDLRPLAGLSRLVEVWLTGCSSVVDLGPLAGKPDLRILEVSQAKVVDLAPLADLTALGMLGLDENRITSVAPLAELRALVQLGLRRNQIADVAPLARLTSLEELRLERNPIVDVAPLAGLAMLRDLDLRGTKVEDLRPIAGLPALKDLRIAGAPAAADDSVLELFRARGIRVDGVGRVGAAAAWTVSAVELAVFKR